MSETLDPDVTTPTPPPLPVPAPPAGASARLQCTNCGGATLYTPGKSATTCTSCASEFPVAVDGAAGEEHDLAAGLADPRATEGGDTSAPAGADDLSQELVCPNCHGAVGFVGTLTATRCPFCARPVTSDDVRTAPDRFPVDGIVPFGLGQPTAEKHVREWISKRRWAPRAYKKYASTGSFAGIYLPFFTFDAYTDTDYRGARGTDKTRTVTRNGKISTEHYVDWESVSGNVTFPLDDVPVPAECSVDPERMRDLEPWPSGSAVAFRPEYLAGFLARRYDRSLEHSQVDARIRQNELIDQAIKNDIGGDHQKIKSKDTTWSKETFRHLLLPVFLLVVTFRSKPYQVAVNGVTGEVHGKRPWSWMKIGSVVLAVILAATAVGVYAWKHESSTTTTDTSSGPSLAFEQRMEQMRQDAAARDAARIYTPQECRFAVAYYRSRTPDTYFPAVRACAGLSSAERRQIGRGLFERGEITAASTALSALFAAPDASAREICRAELALAGARVAAKENTASDERAVARECAGIDQATVDRFSDEYADGYLERRKQALADAP